EKGNKRQRHKRNQKREENLLKDVTIEDLHFVFWGPWGSDPSSCKSGDKASDPVAPRTNILHQYVSSRRFSLSHAPAFLQGSGTEMLRHAVGVPSWNEGLPGDAGSG